MEERSLDPSTMGKPESNDLPPPYPAPASPSQSQPQRVDKKLPLKPPKQRGCVIIHHRRSITLCEFPRDVLQSAEGSVRQEWKRGVEEGSSGASFFELRLMGSPCESHV